MGTAFCPRAGYPVLPGWGGAGSGPAAGLPAVWGREWLRGGCRRRSSGRACAARTPEGPEEEADDRSSWVGLCYLSISLPMM
jgi:hypothetical protein